MTSSKTEPSPKALELVQGAYDMHVHSGPDLMERNANDIEIARAFQARGMKGHVIKSHYVPSAGRARLANFAVPGMNVIGSIVLNRSVGGMNALAVELAARENARIVWFPTVDAENETAGRVDPKPGAKLPFWAKMQLQLRDEGISSEPVRVVDDHGAVLPEVRKVLTSIARNNLVLATAHLSRDEIFVVVEEAVRTKVKHIVITHPEFPSQNLGIDDQKELSKMGALLERCFTTPHTGKTSWETMINNVRATGPEHSFFSTDLGQPSNPPVEDGLPLMIDKFLEAGFSEKEIHTMVVENPTRLAEGVIDG